MNLNHLITMVGRMIFNRVLNFGLKAGIAAWTRPGKPAQGARPDGEDEPRLTPEERLQQRQGREMARRARQAARLTRRISRF